jgi:hypothetical protein
MTSIQLPIATRFCPLSRLFGFRSSLFKVFVSASSMFLKEYNTPKNANIIITKKIEIVSNFTFTRLPLYFFSPCLSYSKKKWPKKMILSQRELFNIPEDVAYLNTAYMSPLLNSAVSACDKGVRMKARPWELMILIFMTQ